MSTISNELCFSLTIPTSYYFKPEWFWGMTAEPNDISTELSQKDPLTNDHENKYRLKAAAFLATISGFGFLAGFGGALAAVKKQEPTSFEQGLAVKTSERVINIVLKIR